MAFITWNMLLLSITLPTVLQQSTFTYANDDISTSYFSQSASTEAKTTRDMQGYNAATADLTPTVTTASPPNPTTEMTKEVSTVQFHVSELPTPLSTSQFVSQTSPAPSPTDESLTMEPATDQPAIVQCHTSELPTSQLPSTQLFTSQPYPTPSSTHRPSTTDQPALIQSTFAQTFQAGTSPVEQRTSLSVTEHNPHLTSIQGVTATTVSQPTVALHGTHHSQGSTNTTKLLVTLLFTNPASNFIPKAPTTKATQFLLTFGSEYTTLVGLTTGGVPEPSVTRNDAKKLNILLILIIGIIAVGLLVVGTFCLVRYKYKRRKQNFSFIMRSRKYGAEDSAWAGPVALKQEGDAGEGRQDGCPDEDKKKGDVPVLVLHTSNILERELNRGVGAVGTKEAARWAEEAPLLYIDEGEEDDNRKNPSIFVPML